MPNIGLFYDIDKFNDVLDRYCQVLGYKFLFHTDLRQYVYMLTHGHAGVVFSVLHYIRCVRAIHS